MRNPKKLIFSLLNLSWKTSTRERSMRLSILSSFFLLGYCIIIFQLLKINFLSEDNVQHKLFRQNILRADIVDRNGHILATNLPTASLYANPRKVTDPKFTAESLKNHIPNIDEKKLTEELSKDKSFIWVQKDLTPKDKDNILALGLPGLAFEDGIKRVYTQGNATSHILGFVDSDNKGIAGAEKYFDEYLSNSASDKPLELSIDYRVQNIVSDELDKVIAKFSAEGGVGIVADAKTGEVISMVSKPDFNPMHIYKNSKESMFNRATVGLYEIGSVNKVVSFSIAFDSNTIGMNDVYKIGDYTVGKRRIKDYHTDNGWKTIPQIFMHSSNIGVGMITREVGKYKFMDYLEKFKLTKKLNIELPERSKPLIPSLNKITDLNLVVMSYGYTYSISPMHFVQAIVPIVNGGIMKDLTIAKKEEEKTSEEHRILKPETSYNMLKLLRLTVERGTGRKAAVKGYLVGGKTGTAEKLGPNGVYLKNSRFSSFIAVAPTIDPRFVVFIFLDNPKGIKETFGFATAGFTAAPVAGNIISKLGALYGLQPYDEEDEEIKNILKVDYEIDNET
jgi:cell division protein FtsI (penicillin-binding protein 3)